MLQNLDWNTAVWSILDGAAVVHVIPKARNESVVFLHLFVCVYIYISANWVAGCASVVASLHASQSAVSDPKRRAYATCDHGRRLLLFCG